MPITLTIAGVDKTALVRNGALSVDKNYGVEVLDVTFFDRGPVATAYRPALGAGVRVEDSGTLVFGGEIVEVLEEPIVDETGTQVSIKARDYTAIFETIVVPQLSLPSQDVLVSAQSLFATYLSPRGFTNIGATSGGPTIASLDVEHLKLSEVFRTLADLSGYFYRANGDKQFAFVAPGALTAPATFSVANRNIRQDGFGIETSRVERATRLFLKSGTPASGAGPVTHSETRTANGTATVFPFNVEPPRKACAIANPGGYAGGVTVVTVDGLFPSLTLKSGDTFTIQGQTQTYTLTGDATGTPQGAYTVAFSPGLTGAVADDTPVVFGARAFIALTVGGGATPLSGGTWSYTAASNSVSTSGAAPSNGTAIVLTHPITFPAVVRVWDSSIVLATGAVNGAASVDALIDVAHLTDVSLVKAWGDEELARRVAAPKRLTFVTTVKGIYPLQRATVNIPDRGVSSLVCLVEQVRGQAVLTDLVEYEVTVVEGDTMGPQWFEAFKSRQAAAGGVASVGSFASGGGTSGGGTSGGTTTGLPIGTTLSLGGDNLNGYTLTTSFLDSPQARPTRFGGDGMAGAWLLRVPVYQLAAGTLEAQLVNQTDATVLATVSSTQVGALLSNAFATATVSLAAPSGVKDVLLQWRVTSGTRKAVMGQATIVRTA